MLIFLMLVFLGVKENFLALLAKKIPPSCAQF